MTLIHRLPLLAASLLFITACERTDTGTPALEPIAAVTEESATAFSVDFERYTLDNGLTVILHVDRSDPVVAVALTAHVGSAREKTGRTGFAHLFEHLLFLESENLGKGGLDAMSARIGGSGANGSTSRDRTNYFQTVPSDALEKMLWAEADKLGWFINTVTDPVLAKEKQVVKNEKRLRVDNVPYGHNFYLIDRHLYPEGHPYSWQVIGSLDDLQAAELADVKEFFNAWYVPNNVTLALAGDFDVDQAKAWIDRYFAEVPRGPDIEPQPKQPATLDETRAVVHEDNFAQRPRLTLTWPTVYRYHPDEHAIDVLAELLSDGKEAPLNQVLVDELELAPEVAMFNYNSELAGSMNLFVTAFDGVALDEVRAGIDLALDRFETRGVSIEALDRIKAGAERRYYEQFDSVLGKAFTLAQYEIFTGDPAWAAEDLRQLKAVTAEDVMRVYREYFEGRPVVATSFVPKGQAALALSGSTPAEVPEEAIVQGAEEEFDASAAAAYEPTPSVIDRSVEPPYGESPVIRTPDIWEDRLGNGVAVSGIEQDELPLVQFSLVIDGGQLLENPAQPGVANLLAESLLKGTARRTTAELENAIKALGADINVSAGQESVRIEGASLASRLDDTMALVTEILLQPRFDEREFELLQRETVARLQAQAADPGSIAGLTWSRLVYGDGSPLANNLLGTEASVMAITLDDLKAWHAASLAPGLARLHVVGDVSPAQVMGALAALERDWAPREVLIPEISVPAQPEQPRLVFVDVPDAKQSVLRIGYPALARTDEDFYPAVIANYRLGGGGFASQLTQQLREGKGYTYNIGSGFSGSRRVGPFTLASSVRSNVTLESLQLIRDILAAYPQEYGPDDLAVTQDFLLKSQARAFETLGSKRGMLENISTYGWPYDYLKQRQAIIRSMDVERLQDLARRYLDPNRMIYLVVGDAATQRDRLEALGLGAADFIPPPAVD